MCKLDKDWREIAKNSNGWIAVVEKMVEDVNIEAEKVAKLWKNEWKQREKKLMEPHADL